MSAIFEFARRVVPLRLIKDSRGAPSWAHTLSIPFSILTMLKWLVGGFTVALPGKLLFTIPPTSGSDTVMVLGVWLAYLSGREYVEKKIEAANGVPSKAGEVDPPGTRVTD